MKICDDLRQAVLQAAIQGKLTTQRKEDGDARELLTDIKKSDTIDGRKVKKKNIGDIMEKDIPFELPLNWCWVKMGSIATVARGGSPRPIKEYLTTADNGINWIKIGDTEKGGKYISTTAERIKPEGAKKSRFVHKGDFLLTNSMSFGRPYILNTEGCIHDGWLVISQLKNVFTTDFLYFLLSSRFAYEQFADSVSGAVVKNLNSDKVANSVFPLPPLAEQHRIVAKVEKLMAEIDELENVENELHALKTAFPGDMKAALLQAAMQGKLTTQRKEDGDARDLLKQIVKEKAQLIKEKKIKKEKPLPEITEEEIPFDVPENWVWVRWGDLSFSIQYGYNAPAKDTGRIKMVRISDIHNNRIIWNKVPFCDIEETEIDNYLLQPKDILFARTGGTVGKSYLVQDVTENAIYAGYLIRTRYSEKLSPKYLKFFMECELYWSQLRQGQTQGCQPNCNGQTLSKMILPLPPLAEQHRIVSKLEKLLPLCDGLVEE